MSFVKISKCPVCGGETFETKFKCTDHLVSNEKFELQTCSKCGFTFTQNFPSADCIGPYYDAPEYVSHSDTNVGLINKLYHVVRSYMLKRKLSIVCKASGKAQGKILDIGCGTGHFLNVAQTKGWQALGVEKNEHARAAAEKHFGLNVKPDNELQNLPNSAYDAVTLWHVLEHLENLNESLAKIHDVLVDNGVAVIAVPNSSSFDAMHYKNKWAAYDVPRHLWHFVPKTLELLAAKHNLKLEKIKPMPFDAFYVAMLTEKNCGHGSFVAFTKALIIGSCGYIKSIFNKSCSSSIIYILRKN